VPQAERVVAVDEDARAFEPFRHAELPREDGFGYGSKGEDRRAGANRSPATPGRQVPDEPRLPAVHPVPPV
jgi:hypothetical protein